jgi:TolB-like protein
LAALVVVVCAFAAWRFSLHTASLSAPRTLAILPFVNLRPDPATDFLGFSLADEVITKLSYVGSLAVRPSSAIGRYRGRETEPRVAGRELGVNTLLTGSYLHAGPDVRINVQLVDVASDRIIWRDSMDVNYENLLTVQDRVAEEIISGLELRLSPSEERNLKTNPSISREAYEDYLRGIDLYAKGDYAGAIRVLEEAARIQPDYAQIWAHLGRAYTTKASLQFGGREEYAQARAAYERALQLNPKLIEPRVYMANLFTDTGRVEQAVPLLRAALEESPNNAEALWELGYAYRFAGMLDQSLTEALKARTIDPSVKLTSSALNTWLYLGQYENFLASLPDVNRVYILFYRGFGEFYLDRRDQALDYFNRAHDLDPTILQAQLGKALAWAILRQPEKGIALLRQTEARFVETGVSDPEGLYKVAQAYAVLGARREALHILDRSITGGFFSYPYFRTDPLLRNIRGEAEFARLLEQARQRQQRFRDTFFANR